MKAPSGVLFAVLTLLLSACATAPPPPSPDPSFAALNILSVAVGPVAYATYQPNEHCTTFIDEDLRSALLLVLRRSGYDGFAFGSSVPRSFAAGSPSPLPGDPPPTWPGPSPRGEGLLSVWIEKYWENNMCGWWQGPQYLTMGAVAVLYAGSPSVEVWRGRALIEEQGTYSASDMIWLATTRLAEQLLRSLPAGPEGVGQR